jgi:hypothetical protein
MAAMSELRHAHPPARGRPAALPDAAPATPSIAETSTSASITAVGASDSLKFYQAADGTSTWQTEQVAPAGSVR